VLFRERDDRAVADEFLAVAEQSNDEIPALELGLDLRNVARPSGATQELRIRATEQQLVRFSVEPVCAPRARPSCERDPVQSVLG